MTRTANARTAGFVFLIYIATGITGMVLSAQATGGAVTAAEKLENIARHASLVRVGVVLTLLEAAYAMVLGVTLFSLTRDEDRDLALMALCCRVTEGVVGVTGPLKSLAVLSLATAAAGTAGSNAAAAALGAVLLRTEGSNGLVAAICFAAGSTLFSYLFLRARSIPVPLAWLGVAASILLVVVLPLQLAGFVTGAVTNFIWLPMLAYEVPLGLWLLVKGVRVQPVPVR